MATGTLYTQHRVGGATFQEQRASLADAGEAISKTIEAAKDGDLTTRHGDTTGHITLDTGHGLTSGTFDVYWATGRCYGVSGTIVSDDLEITAVAGGDVLPAESTEVTVQKQTALAAAFSGTNAILLLATSTKKATIGFKDGATLVKVVRLNAAQVWTWCSSWDEVNPVTGYDIDSIVVTNGDSAAAAQVDIGVGYDV